MSENEMGSTPCPALDALGQLADELLTLCDDEWLRRRDRYMGMSERPLRDSAAAAVEYCAHQVRARLKDLGYERPEHDSYLEWVRNGRPIIDMSGTGGDPR